MFSHFILIFIIISPIYAIDNRRNYVPAVKTKCASNASTLSCTHATYTEILTYINSLDAFNQIQNLELQECTINTITKDLFTIRQLKYIKITKSHVEKITTNAFHEVYTLVGLNLSGNRLGFNGIRKEWFKTLSKLKELDLSDNSIELKSGDFDFLRQLVVLKLSDNFVREIRKDILPLASNLEVLDLSGNSAVGIDSRSFAHYPNLKELNILGNKIRILKNNTFENLGKVVSLNLSRMEIEIISDFTFHSGMKLKNLDLSYNKIKYIGSATFYGLNSLESLNLEGNLKIIDLDYPFLSLISLKDLKLPVYCYQKFIKWGLFTGLRSLTDLNYSYFELRGSGEFYFQGLDNVVTLNLSHNLYDNLASNMFFPMIQLVTLDLSHNKIKQIQVNTFYGLDNLKTLLLNNNNLRQLDFTYPSIRLDVLNLEFNIMYDLVIGHRNKLTSVKSLFLGHNEFKNLDIPNVVDVRVIDLRYNFISEFNFEDFLNRNKNVDVIYLLFNRWGSCTKLTFLMKEIVQRKIVYQDYKTDLQGSPTGNNVLGIPCEFY